MFTETKIILDLCGGSGSWSAPYTEAGYDVRLVTLPQDVRFYIPPPNVYGILAAPPCTVFSNAGLWKQRNEDELIWALSIVDACFRMITICNPIFWAMENPRGLLKQWLGEPRWVFTQNEYGGEYKKCTYLWGKFNIPVRQPVPALVGDMTDRVRSPAKRAITPAGFARAFFEANR